jgi:hypothetical protein
MLGCNCSVFGTEFTRDAIVVATGGDIDTHAHINQFGGAAELRLDAVRSFI